MSTSDDLRAFLNIKFDELSGAVNMFRTLLPHPTKNASVHSAEEGRFVESLLTSFLKDSLPSRVSVGTGFVVNLGLERCSRQTDIIVYDSSRYAPYLKYGDAVVVPAESVVAAISVKERLQYAHIKDELEALQVIGEMCGGFKAPAPYLSLFGFEADFPQDTNKPASTSWRHIQKAYPKKPHGYSANELADSVIVFGKFYIRKKSWSPANKDEKRVSAKYGWFGPNSEHRNAYLQELVHSIHGRLSGRDDDLSPKQKTNHFAAIGMSQLGEIAVKCHNRPASTSATGCFDLRGL